MTLDVTALTPADNVTFSWRLILFLTVVVLVNLVPDDGATDRRCDAAISAVLGGA